jgi:hypothetical protein
MASTSSKATDGIFNTSLTSKAVSIGQDKHDDDHEGANHDHPGSHCHAECQSANRIEKAELGATIVVVAMASIVATHQHQYSSAPPLRPPKKSI